MVFLDREAAGRKLVRLLGAYTGTKNLIVLGLPRGGVPVAFEVAAALEAPLDVFVVRKLGVPEQPELAFGAIAGGVRFINEEIVRAVRLSEEAIERVAAREQEELQRRERVYRRGRPPLQLEGKTVILVDDGIATGASMQAAIAALRLLKPQHIVLAVPVAAASAVRRLRSLVDEFVCLYRPMVFYGIGQFYENFEQVSDEEVVALLRRSRCQYDDSDAWSAPAQEGLRP